MSLQFKSLYRMLCLVVAAQAASAADGGLAKVKPSDCRPRDADSTCATAVAGAPIPSTLPLIPNPVLYDGPLGGVPTIGYSYWGFDFFADQTGFPSLVRPDEFINRSNVPVTITLSFNFPTDRPCNKACLPGLEFELDAGWHKVDPPYLIQGNKVSVTRVIAPGQGYAWVIALWESTNPRLTVTIPKDTTATLEGVGLPSAPTISNEIAATMGSCGCWDGSTAACSDGSRFSNGLLGTWLQNAGLYIRAGSFNSCPPER